MQQPWYKVVLTWAPDQLKNVEQDYQDRLIGYCFNFSEPHFLDITPKEASKGDALQYLAQNLKIQEEKTIAVGDNCNDLTMIRVAGHGFAVENACDELKSAAQTICQQQRPTRYLGCGHADVG